MRLLKKIGLAAGALVILLPVGCVLTSDRSSPVAVGQVVGEISTTIRFFGPNDKIIISAFDDPRVQGVSCHISRAVTGGFWWFLGMSEDPSEAAVACRQIGAGLIYNMDELVQHNGEKVLNERTSILFKTLQVRRTVDKERRVLIYTTNSDKVLDGSPKNSISTVALGAQ